MRLFLILLILLVTGCSSNDIKDPLEKKTDAELYKEGIQKIDDEKYKDAKKYFAKIVEEYPYSEHANKAQLMEAYANYKSHDYDNAIISIDDFINSYPADESIEYVYYLRALSYYNRISEIRLDQSFTLEAKEAFNKLVYKFPDGEFAKDAKMKLHLIDDHLAGKEMEIGRFYLKKGDYIAAINRFKAVIDSYQTTTHIEEALYRLIESYYILGLKNEAEKYAAVLGKNYPSSKWYRMGYDLIYKSEINAHEY